MIEGILPAGVSTSEARHDLPGEPLHAEEEACLARAVDRRRREFVTVRACAAAALGDLGLARPPMVPGPGGAPTWPSGVVGSMTHCDNYRTAAVVPTGVVLGLGIDAEPHAPLPRSVMERVSSPNERRHLAVSARLAPEVCWDRLLFSAKESVYKAWFPLTHRWLGFDDAQLALDAESRTFTARVSARALVGDPSGPAVLTGRWLVAEGLVLTSVVVTPSLSISY